MAPHVGEDAAALLRRVPEPGIVGTGVLLGSPGQCEWAHGIHDCGQLGVRRLNRRQVQLVLEECGPGAHLLGQLEHPPRLSHVAGQWLLTDERLQSGATLYSAGHGLHRLDTSEVGGVERHHFYVVGELLDTVVDRGFAEAGVPGARCQLGRGSAGGHPGELDAANPFHGLDLKPGDEPSADDAHPKRHVTPPRVLV